VDGETKFCIHCGKSIPAVAKFCAICGGAQS
jgi:rRNA maturation endonuclease Nob1